MKAYMTIEEVARSLRVRPDGAVAAAGRPVRARYQDRPASGLGRG